MSRLRLARSVATLVAAACTAAVGPAARAARDEAVDGAATVRYRVVDLGTGVANDLHPAGGVVGTDSRERAVRWTHGTRRILASPGVSTWALYIDGAGRVAGGFHDAAGVEHPVRWTADGRLEDFHRDGDPSGEVVGIDDTGRMAGLWFRLPDVRDGFVVTAEGVREPFPMAGAGDHAIPFAMSASGVIAAEVNEVPGGPRQCARYVHGAFEVLPNPPGARSCSPVALDDAGGLLAIVQTAAGGEGVLWRDGRRRDLDPVDHRAVAPTALNRHGVVVGVQATDTWRSTPFVWSRGVMRRLQDLLADDSAGWVLSGVTSVDDTGRITGRGHLPPGSSDRALLLVPVPAAP